MDLGLKEDFINFTPKIREVKAKNKRMGLYQTKKLLQSKRNCQQPKRETTEWEKILANNSSNKEIIFKVLVYKELM